MLNLHQRKVERDQSDSEVKFKISVEANGHERREFRRHDIEQQGISVDRWDGSKRSPKEFGRIVDLSAGGVRIRTKQTNVKADGQIRLRVELPAYAGICPFVDTSTNVPQPKKDWVGWLSIARVLPVDDQSEVEVCGRLVDMDEMDRGMLGLYLSTQPLAA
jgi:hypothetical protein